MLQLFKSVPNDENFGLVQIESICKRQDKYDTKTKICFGKSRKTLSEKEKMLVTRIFSISNSVFKRLLSQDL